MKSYGSLPTAMRKRLSSSHRMRRGATTVELAVVALPLFIVFFGIVEIGRAMMCVQALEEAARVGCRTAIVDGASASQVHDEVDQLMAIAGITAYTTKISPSNFSDLDQWEPVEVEVKSKLKDHSWMPIPEYLGGGDYKATCVLPREADPEEG